MIITTYKNKTIIIGRGFALCLGSESEPEQKILPDLAQLVDYIEERRAEHDAED